MEILLKSSSKGPWIEILKMLCIGGQVIWDFHRNSLYEDLVFDYLWNSLRCPGMRFWNDVLMSRHRVASCAKRDSCCCSSDNV